MTNTGSPGVPRDPAGDCGRAPASCTWPIVRLPCSTALRGYNACTACRPAGPRCARRQRRRQQARGVERDGQEWPWSSSRARAAAGNQTGRPPARAGSARDRWRRSADWPHRAGTSTHDRPRATGPRWPLHVAITCVSAARCGSAPGTTPCDCARDRASAGRPAPGAAAARTGRAGARAVVAVELAVRQRVGEPVVEARGHRASRPGRCRPRRMRRDATAGESRRPAAPRVRPAAAARRD